MSTQVMNLSASRASILASVLALLSLVACEREQSTPDPAPPEVVARKEAPKPSEQGAQPSSIPPLAPDFPETELGEIPTSEALEHEAENTVAIQNLEAELDRLEAEIVESPN